MNENIDQLDTLIEQIALQEEVQKFLNSKIGVYLQRKMEDDMKSAMLSLIKTNPKDIDIIETLQNKYRVCQMIKIYLAQAIVNGQQASNFLQQTNPNNLNDHII